MIDWTQIIIALIGTGGIAGLFLISEKKASAAIANLLKQYNTLQDLYDKLQARYDIETDKVGKLYDEISDLHDKLDDANTRAATAALKRCDRIACDKRVPPLSDEWNLDSDDKAKKPSRKSESQSQQ
jgi:hypothetical protein